jgi:8-oxo-dGTP diphosphatase
MASGGALPAARSACDRPRIALGRALLQEKAFPSRRRDWPWPRYSAAVNDGANEHTKGSAADLAELARRVEGWRPDLVGTLMFLVDAGRLLLIRKLRGHGAGRINGPGGKPEVGESPLQCVLREIEEEVGVRPRQIRLAAVLRFIDTRDDDWLGYIYVAHGCLGEPRATAEAIPAWYPLEDLPFDEMWEDDRFWLPRVLAGERLRGDFLFAGGVLRAHRLRALTAAERL